MYFAVPLDMTAIEKKSLLSGGEWTLAAEEQGLHGRGSYCRCHSYGCGSGEQCRKHDCKYWCPEYEFFHCYGRPIIINKKIPIGGRQMNEAVCSEVRKRL